MIMGMECVPELKIDQAQLVDLDQEYRSVDTLEVMTTQANVFDQPQDSGPRCVENPQISSRFTRPSLMARRTPSPASFSLP